MSNKMSDARKQGVDKLIALKKRAGSHSPAPSEISSCLGYDPIVHDHCFLSNPYATELVIDNMLPRMDSREGLFKLLESYPASADYVANNLARLENLVPSKMIVTNGGVTAIDWVINFWDVGRLYVPVPTFSTYYELSPKYAFSEEPLLTLPEDPLELLAKMRRANCDTLLLINPNNPTGACYGPMQLRTLIDNLGDERLIVDDSFCHFMSGFHEYRAFRKTVDSENVVFIKSLSKDFGVAGIRLGFIYTNSKSLVSLCKRHITWNLNNFAVLFSDLVAKESFADSYENVRLQYNAERDHFYEELSLVEGIRVLPSQANFFLVKSETFSERFVFELLVNSGIYVRTMGDKIGLDDRWIRVASRTKRQNEYFLTALREQLPQDHRIALG